MSRALATMRWSAHSAYIRSYTHVVAGIGRRLPQPLKNAIKRVWHPWPATPLLDIPATAPRLHERETATYDFLCFSSIDWSFRTQQQWLSTLADAGHRVFSIHMASVLEGNGRTFETKVLRENVWEIRVAQPVSLVELRKEMSIASAVSIVQAAAWAPVALAAREQFGWRVVYDCIDEWTRVPAMSPSLVTSEEELVSQADLVSVSGPRLLQKWQPHARSIVLAAMPENDAALPEQSLEPERSDTWTVRARTLTAAVRDVHPRTSIVIVTYGNRDLTRLCLDAVLRNSLVPNYEVIVVDNASTDGTPAMLREIASARENVRLILNDRNLGFAAANNQGLRAASGERLVLLNNDTVPARGWLPRMLRHLDDPRIGLVVAVASFSGNESRIPVPYTSLGEMPAFAEEYMRSHEQVAFDIDVAAMYCAGMRRDTFDLLGPLDEDYGVGMFEDDDYSHRARLAGLRVVCAEDVFVHHFGQASFRKLGQAEYERLFQRNREHYEKKWGLRWRPHSYR